MISYAQNFEDVILSRALRHVREGFYIDIGANDPIEDSISLAFYERGWRGVHVEPSSDFARRLREMRPDEEVIQAVVGATPGQVNFFEFSRTGLSTADPAVAKFYSESGLHGSEATLDCITLAQLLDSYEDRAIHWLKIDVEGYEAEVIRGWTPSRVRPWILCIEAVDPITHVDVSKKWEDLILGLGYEAVYFDGLNKFYLSEDHPELRENFRLPPNLFDGFVLSGTSTSSFNQRASTNTKMATSATNHFNEASRSQLLLKADELRSQLHQVEKALHRLSTHNFHARDADRAGRIPLIERIARIFGK